MSEECRERRLSLLKLSTSDDNKNESTSINAENNRKESEEKNNDEEFFTSDDNGRPPSQMFNILDEFTKIYSDRLNRVEKSAEKCDEKIYLEVRLMKIILFYIILF